LAKFILQNCCVNTRISSMENTRVLYALVSELLKFVSA
jgi:hypothetical protein